MLNISRLDNGIVRVEEVLPNFQTTKIKVILYDIENRKKKVCDDPWYPMSDSDVAWVNKYYIPKLNEYSIV